MISAVDTAHSSDSYQCLESIPTVSNCYKDKGKVRLIIGILCYSKSSLGSACE